MNKEKVKTANRRLLEGNKQKLAVIEKSKENKRKKNIYILIAIIITAIVYALSLNNGWIKNWDDGGYVTEHDVTSSLSASNLYKLTSHDISRIFSTFYKGNYHPLTTLIYAVEYNLFKDNAKPYHFINLIFHLLNVLLVFIFLKKITKKPEIGFIAALLFGIHPMHVESVAWISELKDVLFTLFFLLSLIYYLKSYDAKEGKMKYYLISLLMFVLSSLSKSAAVCLPAVLVLLDFYKGKKWKWKIDNRNGVIGKTMGVIAWLMNSIAHKALFFIVSMIFGIVAIKSQGAANAIQDLTPLFSFLERLMIASYTTITYLYKLIVPIDLACMYPYPDRINGHLPMDYYLTPIILIALVSFVVYSWKYGKDIVFGTIFFFLTIALVLQLLPVGGAVLAERYTYVPYIGLFMIIGKGYVYFHENRSKYSAVLRSVYTIIIVAMVLVFSVMSFQRILIWKNGEVLFTDLIKKYPTLPFAYNNRGYLYYNFLKKYDKALADYNKCIEMDSTFHRAYSNRGVLYYNTAKPDLAIKDFTKAIHFKDDNTDAWIGRANSYSTLKKFDLALPDYNRYISFVADDAKSYLWRGIALYNLGRFDEAYTDFIKCIDMTPDNDNAYLWRGLVYFQRKDYKAAIKDFDLSLQLNPKQSEPYSWRGFAEFNLQMTDQAIADYTTALEKNPKDAATFINRSTAYYNLKNYEQAFKDYCSAGDLGYALDKDYFFKLKALAGK